VLASIARSPAATDAAIVLVIVPCRARHRSRPPANTAGGHGPKSPRAAGRGADLRSPRQRRRNKVNVRMGGMRAATNATAVALGIIAGAATLLIAGDAYS
jgi:hypothetical protein